jgi:hypothetical protein
VTRVAASRAANARSSRPRAARDKNP